nr:dynamin superfamily protein [Variosea sp.]
MNRLFSIHRSLGSSLLSSKSNVQQGSSKGFLNSRQTVLSSQSKLKGFTILNVRFFAGSPIDPDGVIPTLGKIQRIIGTSLNYPRIVVVGNQSAGKSSVLEAIVGESFLPKGTNMVTRRPLEITLVRDESAKYFLFEDGHKLHDIDAVRDRLNEENKDFEFSDSPIRLEVHSPDVQNVTLVDLPGYIHAVTKDQSKDLPKKIQKLCKNYIDKKDNLILVIVSAAEDTAMSVGLKEVYKLEDWESRTLGVLTKMDLRNTKDIVKTLKNNEYPLGMGYIGVRCRTDKEIDDKINFNELIKKEDEFIKSRKLHQSEVKVGIPVLREELSKELLSRIATSFPAILEQLTARIEKAKTDEQFLQSISAEKDLTNVAKELEKLVMQFHPSSPTRLVFEKHIRQNIDAIVDKHWNKAIQTWFGDLKKIKEEPSSILQEAPRDAEVRKHSANLLSALNVQATVPLKSDFSSVVIYGDSTPDKIDDAMLKEASESTIRIGASSPFYQITFPEDYVNQRLIWQRNLTEAVATVAHKSELPEACRKQAIDDLLQFVEKAALGAGPTKSQHFVLAKYFFRYLLEKIADRTNQDRLTDSMQTMLNREKRALISYSDLLLSIRNNLPVPAEKSNSYFHSKSYPVPVHAYSDLWTKSYFDVMKKRTSDDLFRVLAVELINPLIFETIHYSLNLFKSGKIFREAGRQLKFMKELTQYRDIIEKAAAKYTKTHPQATVGTAKPTASK